jgi:hypothetical protein
MDTLIDSKLTLQQPTLYVPNENRTGRLEYISNELLRLIGVNDKLLIKEGDKIYLTIGENIVITESKLLELFSIVSLEREFEKSKDVHGRFDQTKMKWDVLQPEINKFVRNIQNELGDKLSVLNDSFKVIFTHDVDWVSGRVMTSVLKSFKDIFRRNRSWITLDQAFNKNIFLESYSEMLLIEKDYNIKTWNFLLSGPTGNKRYSSRYDINWELSRNLIEIINESGNEIGLHGSYYAVEDNLYKAESERLASVTGKPIIAHRNHYLRFNPERFNSQLETAGIKYDFSVGFSSVLGFRAGLATPYLPFNHEKSIPSKVIEIPLIYMERQNHLDDEAGILEKLSLALEEVKKYNGCVSILFHPESFAVDKRWLRFYERVIKSVIDLGADISNELPIL